MLRCLTVGFFLLAATNTWPRGDLGTFTVQFENDRIAKTDRHYTHGTRLSWVSLDLREKLPWASRLLEWVYPFDPAADARIGVALGQNIYTPEDIAATELIVDDRPYAGWLYAGLLLHTELRQSFGEIDFKVLDTMELNLGVVGPSSYAQETQQVVHRIIGVQRPNGWDNQLHDEPGIVLTLERKWRSPASDFAGLQWDVIPHAGISVGNVSTALSTGATLRMGHDLAVDFGPPHIRPNLTGTGSFRTDAPLAWYIFAGIGGRAIARDIFLDGNTFRDSHSVDKRHFVGDLQLGAAFANRGARLTFSHVSRTREFSGQRRADRFGAVSLSVTF